MSKSEPKFIVGEAVMVRSSNRPDLNTDFAIVLSARFSQLFKGFIYSLSDEPERETLESSLRPIPKEKPNGIDATEYIKSLTGIEAQLAEVVS